MKKYALPQRSYGYSALETDCAARPPEAQHAVWVAAGNATLGKLAGAHERRDFYGDPMVRRRNPGGDFEQHALRQYAELVSTRDRLRTMVEYARAWAASHAAVTRARGG